MFLRLNPKVSVTYRYLICSLFYLPQPRSFPNYNHTVVACADIVEGKIFKNCAIEYNKSDWIELFWRSIISNLSDSSMHRWSLSEKEEFLPYAGLGFISTCTWVYQRGTWGHLGSTWRVLGVIRGASHCPKITVNTTSSCLLLKTLTQGSYHKTIVTRCVSAFTSETDSLPNRAKISLNHLNQTVGSLLCFSQKWSMKLQVLWFSTHLLPSTLTNALKFYTFILYINIYIYL